MKADNFPFANVSKRTHLLVVLCFISMYGIYTGVSVNVNNADTSVSYAIGAGIALLLVVMKYKYTPCLKNYGILFFALTWLVVVVFYLVDVFRYSSTWMKVLDIISQILALCFAHAVLFLMDHNITVGQTLLPSVLFGQCLLLVNVLVSHPDPDSVDLYFALLNAKYYVSVFQLLVYKDSSFRNAFNPWFLAMATIKVGSYLLVKSLGPQMYATIGYLLNTCIVTYIIIRRYYVRSKNTSKAHEPLLLINESEMKDHSVSPI